MAADVPLSVIVAPLPPAVGLTVPEIVNDPDCAPVPLSGTARGELEALLVMETVPLAPPAELGANSICTTSLWPAAIEDDEAVVVTALNPGPLTVTAETFTLADPVLDIVTL